MHTMIATRSDFSIGEAIQDTKAIINDAVRIGENSVALTDTMSVTGMIDFTNRAEKSSLKPIIGTRLRLTDHPTWRPKKGEKKKDMPRTYFITAYALTELGMKSIFRLLTLGNSEGRFYYVSKLSFDDLFDEMDKISSDDLAIVLGDESSVLEHPDHHIIALRLAEKVAGVYTPFVAIDTPYYGALNKISGNLVENSAGVIKPILVRPSLYGENSADAQEIMTGISTGAKISDGWFRSRYVRNLHPFSKREMINVIKTAAKHLAQRSSWSISECIAFFQEGIANTDKLVDSAIYKWSKADISLPAMAPDEYKAVAEQCATGWKLRFSDEVFGHKPSSTELKDVYMPRLKYELGILKRLNFSGYFLLVEDIVRYSKTNDILVGPGRGSVGGSLVAYLMGITDCDPIRFGLMFERFINPDRLDLPDIDLDFMSTRRHEVIEYLINKYGADRVAGVSNFGTLAAASAMRDVGRTTGISDFDYSVSKMVPKKHGANVPLPECRVAVPEIDSFANKYPYQWRVMEQLEGTIRNMATHAAGIVVSGCDLTERAVVERRKDVSVVCWDKRVVEEQGLIKVDVLGLSTLDIIGLTQNYIKERHGHQPDLHEISLDDEAVLRAFADGRTTGIFQFESGGMRRLLKDIAGPGSITFDEITACTALYRPGPMESGMMDSFHKRKAGTEFIEYDHPLMEPILESTYGVIVYQEQVMKISQAIAGYTGAEADILRKIMGKKLPEAMELERGKFVKGCIDTIGCVDVWAEKLFDMIAGFAGYGFNLSHSVEYSLISYQVMWLKTNFPVEFYAAALTLMDSDKLPGLLKDARDAGVDIGMPDINNSTGRFEILTDTQLSIPFQRIKGLSMKAVEAILLARNAGPFTSKADFISRVERRRCNIKVQSNLDAIGAFYRIEPTTAPPNDPSRIKAQIELLPGLISAHVPIHRDMHKDKATKIAIGEVIAEYTDIADGLPTKPNIGRSGTFMIISDAPGPGEDNNGLMGFSRSNDAVLTAMDAHGFGVQNCYWTALLKRPKKDKMITPDEVEAWSPFLDREIDILKPPVIVLLGSTVTRRFLKDFKGKASDQAGSIVYNAELDANLIIGFNPGEIYHDPEKMNNMNMVFSSVADLLK